MKFQDIRARLAQAGDSIADFSGCPPAVQWDVYEMYLLQESPSLGREDLEIEADINFHAGVFLPALAVAV